MSLEAKKSDWRKTIPFVLRDYPLWNSWSRYISIHAVSTGQNLASHFYSFLKQEFKVDIHKIRLDILISSLGFSIRRVYENQNPSVRRDGGFIEISTDLGGTILSIYIGTNVHGKRRNSILAHELGHLCCEIYWFHLSEVQVPSLDHKEAWCYDFGMTFIMSLACDDSADELIYEYLDKHDAAHCADRTSIPFKFEDLSDYVRQSKLTLRGAISSLNYHPALGEWNFAIGIIEHSLSKVRRVDKALRFYMTALPYWEDQATKGFIANNKRISAYGFHYALSHYQNLQNRESIMVSDVFSPIYENINTAPKYTRLEDTKKMATQVEYTAVDAKREGRYLLSIWNWPQVTWKLPFIKRMKS